MASHPTGGRKTRKPILATVERSSSNNNPATVRQGPSAKPKIWIDLDNTPHVPFFEPIIDELKARGFPLLITARDAFQVCDLADKKHFPYVKVGRHNGKSRFWKVLGLVFRACQLAPLILSNRPKLGLSHGSRSQLLLGNVMGISTFLIEDYEFCQFPLMMRPTWLMAPSVIPDSSLPVRREAILRYSGIKEDVYAWKLLPDPSLAAELGIQEFDLVITVRPPATEAHYHNPESEGLFEAFMNRATRTPGTKLILLPRNSKQREQIYEKWPEWFNQGKTVVPKGAVDGLNLIWHSDFVLSGGGTMNREAAALGVPVYSIFRGTIGAVDRHLNAEGRLVLVESIQDVHEKISFTKRIRKPLANSTSRQTLFQIVDAVEKAAGGRKC